MRLLSSPSISTIVVGLLAVLLAAPTAAAAEAPQVDALRVVRLVDDGPDHALSVGPGVSEFADLLVTADGSVIVASSHDGRQQLGAFDAWPLSVWAVGEPGSSTILVPTAPSGVAEGPDGSLWVAGEGRFLASFDGESWQVHVKQQDVEPYIDHVVADDGSVWALFESGLLRFDGERWARRGAAAIPTRSGRDLEKAADGRLWLLADGGQLATFDGAAWRRVRPLDRGEDVVVLAIDVAKDGLLWAAIGSAYDGGCREELVRFDGTSWQAAEEPARSRIALVIDRLDGRDRGRRADQARTCRTPWLFRVDGEGHAWVSTGLGLASSSAGFPLAILFADTFPQAAEVDANGALWVLAPDEDPSDSDLYVVETVATAPR